MHHLARAKEALPLSEGMSSYGDDHRTSTRRGTEHDVGCACDSSWPVGFGPGEYQLGEYYGRTAPAAVPDWLGVEIKRRAPHAIDVILRNLTHWLISTQAWPPGSGTRTRTTRGTTRRRRRSDHRDQRRTR